MRVVYLRDMQDGTSTEELGTEIFNGIDRVLLPDWQPEGGHQFLQHRFSTSNSEHWKVVNVRLVDADILVTLRSQTEPGINYGKFGETTRGNASSAIRAWKLVWVDFSHTSCLHSVNQNPISNRVDRRGHLPGEQHKLRPSIVIHARGNAVTVVPLSTKSYNSNLTHSIEISKESFTGSSFKNKPRLSYAVLDWITVVSPYRIFTLPDTAGNPLRADKAPTLTLHDRQAVQRGLAACFYPSSQSNYRQLNDQLSSKTLELKSTKNNCFALKAELERTYKLLEKIDKYFEMNLFVNEGEDILAEMEKEFE